MSSVSTVRKSVNRLYGIRNCFGKNYAEEKLALLARLDNVQAIPSVALESLHAALCFIRAFPDTNEHHEQALLQLQSFAHRIEELPAQQRSELADSGIVGTSIHYRFSYEVAGWLSRRSPNAISIDWSEVDDTAALDDLLSHLLHSAEDDYFDSGFVSTEDWINLAASGTDSTDFDWLMAQLGEARLRPYWAQLYDNAEIPLCWELRNAALSKTDNVMPIEKIQSRIRGMRKRVPAVKKEIMRPLATVQRLPPRSGARLIDVAIASLAVRHRETNHFNHANRKEVYLADVGEGVSIAVFGMLEKHRYPLESTLGYLILSNGVPIGYGGGSALFRQVNTGINIFDEYRGSEAAFLWTQVMRVYHALCGCTRFIVNAYQFGNENTEALASGAFWFHYRLGYRPVRAEIRALARRESIRTRKDRAYRCDRKTLQQLAICDMHLTLPGARASDLFDEHWIETSSMLATKELANVGGPTRASASERVARNVALDLGMRRTNSWSDAEQHGMRRLAPLVAAAKPTTWSHDARRSMRKLLRAKGGAAEMKYARLLGEHDAFLSALRKVCRHADD